MAYPYKQIFAVDESAPERVAQNGVVTIFAPGDTTKTPLAITSLEGLPLPNPIQVNGEGYGPPFMHATLSQVAWSGAGLSGTFESYEGMRDEAVAARLGASNAAADAEQSRLAAEEAVRNAQAPSDEAVDAGIERAGISAMIDAAVVSKADREETVELLDAQATTLTARVELQNKWILKSITPALGKLTDWKAALTSGNATAVMVGDSITEGSGTSDIRNRWQTQVQDILRAQQSSIAGSEFPFIPGYPVTSAPGKPVRLSGPVTRQNGTGISGRTAVLTAADSLAEFEFYGTSFDVLYFSASATGLMGISIDGGPEIAVETNPARSGTAAGGGRVWKSELLQRGNHTVRIRRSPSNPNTTDTIYIEGLRTYDRDETQPSIRIIDGGYHGAHSGSFNAPSLANQAISIKAVGGADLIVIGFGVNDANNTVAKFRENIQGIISAYRAAGLNKSYVLLGMYQTGEKSAQQWRPYLDALASIAYSDPKVAFLDLTRHMPVVPDPYDSPASLGLYNDRLHLNDAGNAWVGRVVASALG